MSIRRMRLLCPNGHLGFAPLKPGRFQAGVEMHPDVILADSGSDDIGPVPLGTDTSASPLEWQKHDLEQMLLAARKLQVPLIVGSAGDTGSNSRVDMYVRLIEELADKHRLPEFKVGSFYSEVPVEALRQRLHRGEAIDGLDGRPPLTTSDLDRTSRVVAVAGIHPYVKLLDEGADVIIGGRSSDSVIFAAPMIRAGFPEANAYLLGKLMECASFCAEPYAAKESVMGEVSDDDVRVTALHPSQRCTVASVAGHAMYERSNPYYEYVAGGMLDMSCCSYEQASEKTTRVTGAKFTRADPVMVKLEGSGSLGERYVGIASVRDPYTIDNIDQVIGWARDQVRERFGDDGYELHYNVYGKNGVMGETEPIKQACHELCLIVQGVAPSQEMAKELTMTATRQLFYARLPEVKGTAGGVAFTLDEVLHASPAHTWTLNHVMTVSSPLELFPTRLSTAGVKR